MNSARVTAIALVATAAVAHRWLEARMITHMLVQLPMLLAGGLLLAESRLAAAHSPPPGWTAGTTVLIWVFVTGVITTWMIPRALDAAVEQPLVNLCKLYSLVSAGTLGRLAWRQASVLLRTFVFGSLAWMTAAAGVLFLDTPARLCTSYGRGEQQQVGVALVALTVLLVLLAGSTLLRRSRVQG